MKLLPESSVGRKLIMAVTGFGMVGFIVVHLLGNSSVYAGPDGINAYAAKLHGLGPFVWIFRFVMLALFSLHVFFGVQLALENRAARPEAYAVKKDLRATFASRNMIWTGVIVGAFLVYHLLHFTFHVTDPGISPLMNPDAEGRPDVFGMVVQGFRSVPVALFYIGAVMVLALHLTHGIQSLFQTFGLNNDRYFPFIVKAGAAVAVILSLGYAAIPIVIAMGVLKI